MHIVTGGAGFIGSAYVAYLNSKGIDRVLIVDELESSDKWKNLRGLKFKDYIHKDKFLELIQSGSLERDVQALIHMGASSSTTELDVDYLYSNNFEYTRTLAEFALERSIRFVYASSAATYGAGELGYSDQMPDMSKLRPLNAYGYSKQLFDLWAAKQGLFDEIVGLKFFNVYGPNEYHKGGQRSVIHQAFGQIQREGKVKLFKSYRDDYSDGEQKRDFVYVKDCCRIIDWFKENPSQGGLFNVGTGNSRSWNELANAVFAACGKASNIEYIDMPEQIRNHYQYFTEAPMDKLRRIGYSQEMTSLEDGAKDYVQQHLLKEDPFLDKSSF